MNNYSRFISSFLIIVILASGFILPKKAEAVFGVGDIVFDPTIYGIDFAKIGLDIARWVKEDLVKGLRDLIAKRIIDYIVDQTIVWVQGGGTPKFVTDWNGFLQDAANIAFDQVIKDVGLARLCSPFGLQLRLSLLPTPRFSQYLSCTVDQFVANLQNFYLDFSQGGWLAYNELWQPQNNIFGAQLLVADRVIFETSRQTAAAKSEAEAGGGFLSTKRCVERAPVPPERAEFETEGPCLKYETTTPGSIVGKAVGEAVTSDIQWAANIQSWTAALINAVINRLIGEGLGAAKTAVFGEPTTSGNQAAAYFPAGYQSAINTELNQQKQQLINDLQLFLNEEQYLLNRKAQSVSLSGELVVKLNELKSRNCGNITNLQIETAESDLVRLNGQVEGLRMAIVEISNAINLIRRAGTTLDLASFQIQFYPVFNKYNTPEFRQQILDGSQRQAADQELAAKQAEVDNARSQINSCQGPINI